MTTISLIMYSFLNTDRILAYTYGFVGFGPTNSIFYLISIGYFCGDINSIGKSTIQNPRINDLASKRFNDWSNRPSCRRECHLDEVESSGARL